MEYKVCKYVNSLKTLIVYHKKEKITGSTGYPLVLPTNVKQLKLG